MKPSIVIAIIQTPLDTRGMVLGKVLFILAVQINGIDTGLHRIHAQDVVGTGHRVVVAEHTHTGTIEIRGDPITDKFHHFCIPCRGQTLHIVLRITHTTPFERTEPCAQRTRIRLPIVVGNAQHITPKAVDIGGGIRKATHFIALVIILVAAVAGRVSYPILTDE